MSWPATTLAGPVLVIATSGDTFTDVVADAVLSSGLASSALLEAVTVLLMEDVVGVLELTCTTIVNVAVAPLAKVPIVAMKLPVPPPDGFVSVKVGPAVCEAETNVVSTGTASVIIAFVA